ncbi:MAG: hypothetical protein ACOY31_02005 [Bacillota bacterium]
MYIGDMLPLLLDIIGRQAGTRVDKSSPKQGMGELSRQDIKGGSLTETAAASGVRSAVKGEATAQSQSSPVQNLPDFIPLPLKSPLFAESRFFIKNDRENPAVTADREPAGVFINLRTENLGNLWIALYAGAGSLTLSFYSDSETSTAHVRGIIPDMVESLKDMGYQSVSAAGITRPGIKSCADLAPGTMDSGAYMLNREV